MYGEVVEIWIQITGAFLWWKISSLGGWFLKKPMAVVQNFHQHTQNHRGIISPAQWVPVPRKTNTRYVWLSSHRTASVIWRAEGLNPLKGLLLPSYLLVSVAQMIVWSSSIPSWVRETYIQIISDPYICHKLAEIEWAPHWPQYQHKVSHVVFDDPTKSQKSTLGPGASNWCTEESPLGWGKQRKGNIQLFILGRHRRHRVMKRGGHLIMIFLV